MIIEIKINDSKCYQFDSFEQAINGLYNLKWQQITSGPAVCRCSKCVYENSCSNIDIDGSCSTYRRDPPDGGYYG